MDNQIIKSLPSVSERLAAYLSKSVASHPSQTQQRVRSGRFATAHHSRTQARNEKGRFVGLLPQGERDAAYARLPVICGQLRHKLLRHQQDAESGHLSAIEAGKRGGEDIREYYESLYRLGKQGAGNPGIILSSMDRALINRAATDEADYFVGFMKDVTAGRGVMPYPQRLDCYENAGRHAYWLGWTTGSTSPRRRITWKVGATEHCHTCLGLSEKGPMTVKQFTSSALSKGYLPQSGDLECKGIHCKCYLIDRYDKAQSRQ